LNLNQEISAFIKEHGASLVGFADLKEIDAEARDNFPYAISIAIALDPKVIDGIKIGPTAKYRAEYKRVNLALDSLALKTAQFLADKGYKAKVRPATVEENQTTLTADLPHKTVATRAGLGWIGKSALLITREYGPAVRFVTVLTDAPVTPGEPVNESLCTKCMHCVNACPAQAHTGRNWKLGMRREELYDAFKCREMTRNLSQKLLNETISICGLCLTACPWTQRYLKRATE
jgi:epoxyqueuosine reductase